MTDDVKERMARAISTTIEIAEGDHWQPAECTNIAECADAARSALRPGDEIDLGEFGTVVLVPTGAGTPTRLVVSIVRQTRQSRPAPNGCRCSD